MNERKYRAQQAITYLIHSGIASSQKEVGELLGYDSESYFSQIINGGKPLSEKVIVKLASLSKELNLEWLLTGEGGMLSTPKEESNADIYVPQEVMEVQIIPFTARAGSLGDYEQIRANEEWDTMLVPTDKVRHGKYLVFTVGGSSMEPTLLHGDKVLARLVQRHLWEDSRLHLRQWSVWVIVTLTEGILIKDIIEHNVEGKRILLHSFNDAYSDFWVNLSDVVDIFNVVELVHRKL